MTDLCKAAEMALEALDCLPWKASPIAIEATQALRTALAQPEQECVYPECETNVGCDGPCGSAVEQEPVAWMFRGYFGTWEFTFSKTFAETNGTEIKPLYAQPVDAVNISQEPVDETAKCGHECPEWDFMEIDKDSPEFDACLCFPKPSLWLAIAQDGRVKYTTDSGRASDWKKSGSYRLVRDYYTAPPKREWVGLTDDERADCWSSSAVQSAINIEAKLKEKNT